MNKVRNLRDEIKKRASIERAEANAWFFKTGKGEYGEGDTFIGLSVPDCRKIAKQFHPITYEEIKVLLKSPIHEERLIAIFIMIDKFNEGDEKEQKYIYDFYLNNTRFVNNWDLVDASADKIVGEYLLNNSKLDELPKILYTLAHSENLWERRIAMIATFQYTKAGKPQEALQVAELLLHDRHDLIQKAVGWMLREVGKKCGQEVEEGFLKQHYKNMGRTALRYAIEKFPEELRQQYLKGNI